MGEGAFYPRAETTDEPTKRTLSEVDSDGRINELTYEPLNSVELGMTAKGEPADQEREGLTGRPLNDAA